MEADQFITELQGKYLPFMYRDEGDDKLVLHNVQVAVRPIQLWEVAFPEEHKDLVLTTILGKDKGIGQHRKHDKIRWAIRKALGVQDIPDYKTDKIMPLRRAGVETIGIGVKEDYWINKDGKHVTKEEKDDQAYEGL